jgi:hypothetical protein
MDSTELHTRVGVAELLATYQYLADSGRTRELSDLFLRDAIYRANARELVGRQAILEFFGRAANAFVSADILPARHHLTSVYIEPRSATTADTYACFQLVGSGGLDHWGTYRDELVQTADGWRFARRQAKVEGHIRGSAVIDLLGLGPTQGSVE